MNARPSATGVIASHVMPNRHEALRPAGEWLQAELLRLGLPSNWQFKFDLCAQEALLNIISYAYGAGEMRDITLRLLRMQDDLMLEIEDDGVLFNPLLNLPHATPASIQEAPIGGLGVDLLRSMMDECRYEVRDSHNVLQLVAHGAFAAAGVGAQLNR